MTRAMTRGVLRVASAEAPDDGDMQVLARGATVITPLRLDVSAALSNPLRAALEQPPR